MRRCCTRSTRRGRSRCRRGCGSRSSGRRTARGPSPTSPASSRAGLDPGTEAVAASTGEPGRREDRVTGIVVPVELDYTSRRLLRSRRSSAAWPRDGSSGSAAPSAARSTSLRGAPARSTACRPAEEVELPDTGIVTTFCIVNVPFLGQKIEPPYVSAYVLLEGADIALPAPDPGRARRRGADGHEGQGGVEAARAVGHHHREHLALRADGRTGRGLRVLPGAPVERDRDTNMRDVAVVGFAQRQMAHFDGSPSMVEWLVPTFRDLWEQTGWTKHDIGFLCSGSSDYLAGRSFSFVSAVDAIGTLPPVNESHVEMDAAWALYEAWVKIQTGEVDTRARLRVRQVLCRRAAPGPRPAARPLRPHAALAGRRLAGRATGARSGLDRGLWSRGGHGASGRAVTAGGAGQPRRAAGRRHRASTSSSRSRCSPTRCAPTTARRSPTGSRRSSSPPATGPAPSAVVTGQRGSPASSTGWTPRTSALRDLSAVASLPAPAPRSTWAAWRWPSSTRRSATRS